MSNIWVLIKPVLWDRNFIAALKQVFQSYHCDKASVINYFWCKGSSLTPFGDQLLLGDGYVRVSLLHKYMLSAWHIRLVRCGSPMGFPISVIVFLIIGELFPSASFGRVKWGDNFFQTFIVSLIFLNIF